MLPTLICYNLACPFSALISQNDVQQYKSSSCILLFLSVLFFLGKFWREKYLLQIQDYRNRKQKLCPFLICLQPASFNGRNPRIIFPLDHVAKTAMSSLPAASDVLMVSLSKRGFVFYTVFLKDCVGCLSTGSLDKVDTFFFV